MTPKNGPKKKTGQLSSNLLGPQGFYNLCLDASTNRQVFGDGNTLVETD